MPDRLCHTCREPWDVMMEPDAGSAEVKQWLEDEYGEGFTLYDIGGISWAIKACPMDHASDKVDPDALEADFDKSLFD